MEQQIKKERESFYKREDESYDQYDQRIKNQHNGVETGAGGGVFGALIDGMISHTNYPPEGAARLKSIAKLGALIGMGVLGWKTIKKVFNIGGKNEKGEGLKWGLGAAAVLLGIPAITGQSLDKFLFTGDSKDAWQKTKDLLHLGAITDAVEGMFS